MHPKHPIHPSRAVAVRVKPGTVKRAVALLMVLCMLMVSSSGFAALSTGSRGNDVTRVQQKLKQWGYYKGAVDGVYGSETAQAVMSFQRKNGLTPDGVVGDATAAAIGLTLSGTAPSGGGNTSRGGSYSSEMHLLARLVHGEARGEIYQGKVAVAAVVLNRVRSSKFPNTIAGVIYQPDAFTAVNDGQINLAPDAESMRAARDAMNGWDPSYGCLYYYNPRTATSRWIFSRKTVIVIGNHVFCN